VPDVLVRNIPQPTLEALKRRSELNHRSLQQELLTILEGAARERSALSPADVAAAIRERLARSGRSFESSTDLVREDRER